MKNKLLDVQIHTNDKELQLEVTINGTTHTFQFESTKGVHAYLAEANINAYKLIDCEKVIKELWDKAGADNQ
jgi:hypothetical protein